MYKTIQEIDQEIERLEMLEDRYLDTGAMNAASSVSEQIRQLERKRSTLKE